MRRALVFNIGPGPDPDKIHGGWSRPCWYWSLAHYLEMNSPPKTARAWVMADLMDHVERTALEPELVMASVVPPAEG